MRSILAAAALLAPLLLPAVAPAAPPAPERLLLDTRSGEMPWAAGPVVTARPLEAGVRYDVYVRGTFSFWPPELWGNRGRPLDPARPPGEAPTVALPPFRPHGLPEPAPMFPSPGGPSGPAGVDAEFAFALIEVPGSDFPRFPLPKRVKAFEIDLGAGWHHPRAEGEPMRLPSPDHTYRYVVVGQGKPLRARLRDYPVGDNYGALEILVTVHDPHGPPPLTLAPETALRRLPAGAAPFPDRRTEGIVGPRHEAGRSLLRPRRDPRPHEPRSRPGVLRPQPARAAP